MPPVTAGRNAAKSPRDLTGRIHAQQQAKRTRELQEEGIPMDVRLAGEYQRGLNDGHRIGVEAFTGALVALYEREGISAVEEFLKEEAA